MGEMVSVGTGKWATQMSQEYLLSLGFPPSHCSLELDSFDSETAKILAKWTSRLPRLIQEGSILVFLGEDRDSACAGAYLLKAAMGLPWHTQRYQRVSLLLDDLFQRHLSLRDLCDPHLLLLTGYGYYSASERQEQLCRENLENVMRTRVEWSKATILCGKDGVVFGDWRKQICATLPARLKKGS